MGGYVLEKGCCGCCSLKTCCILQAVLAIAESLLHIGIVAGIFIYREELAEGKNSQEREQLAMGAAIACVLAPLALFSLINACILIHGARTDNAKLVRIYLICTVIALVLDFIVRCALIRMKIMPLSMTISTFIFRALQIYFFWHAYSLYKQLKGPSTSYQAAAQHA